MEYPDAVKLMDELTRRLDIEKARERRADHEVRRSTGIRTDARRKIQQLESQLKYLQHLKSQQESLLQDQYSPSIN